MVRAHADWQSVRRACVGRCVGGALAADGWRRELARGIGAKRGRFQRETNARKHRFLEEIAATRATRATMTVQHTRSSAQTRPTLRPASAAAKLTLHSDQPEKNRSPLRPTPRATKGTCS